MSNQKAQEGFAEEDHERHIEYYKGEEEDDDDAVKPLVHRTGLVRKSQLPTPEEVEAHMISHVPFRSWCSHCLHGKGVASPHTCDSKGVRDFNVVHMDYMFFEKMVPGESEDDFNTRAGAPILVMYDEDYKTTSAQFVQKKGVNDWSIKVVKAFLSSLGSKRVLVRNDQEPAIVALRNEIKHHTHVEVIDENSHEYDSQTNGLIENVVKRVQGQFRTIKDAVESRYKYKIPSNHACLGWLLQYAVHCINRYVKGQDGKTAHERLRGKLFKGYMAEFSEMVHYLRVNSRGKQKDTTRWSEGLFLGRTTESGEVVIGTSFGVIKARDIRRFNQEDARWNLQKFNELAGTPWKPNPASDDQRIHIEIKMPAGSKPFNEVPEARPEGMIRRLKINEEDANRRGLWARCIGCRSIRDHVRRQGHSEDCRQSITDMLKAENDPRIEQEDYKFSKRIAAKLVQDHGPAPDSAEPEFAAPSSNAQQEPAAVAHKRKLGDDVTDSGQPAKSAKRIEEDMDVDQVNRVLELSSFNLCDASVKNKILKAVVDKRFLATVYHEEVAIKNLKPTELQRQNVKGTIAEVNRLLVLNL
jgi:hypothetical protein